MLREREDCATCMLASEEGIVADPFILRYQLLQKQFQENSRGNSSGGDRRHTPQTQPLRRTVAVCEGRKSAYSPSPLWGRYPTLVSRASSLLPSPQKGGSRFGSTAEKSADQLVWAAVFSQNDAAATGVPSSLAVPSFCASLDGACVSSQKKERDVVVAADVLLSSEAGLSEAVIDDAQSPLALDSVPRTLCGGLTSLSASEHRLQSPQKNVREDDSPEPRKPSPFLCCFTQTEDVNLWSSKLMRKQVRNAHIDEHPFRDSARTSVTAYDVATRLFPEILSGHLSSSSAVSLCSNSRASNAKKANGMDEETDYCSSTGPREQYRDVVTARSSLSQGFHSRLSQTSSAPHTSMQRFTRSSHPAPNGRCVSADGGSEDEDDNAALTAVLNRESSTCTSSRIRTRWPRLQCTLVSRGEAAALGGLLAPSCRSSVAAGTLSQRAERRRCSTCRDKGETAATVKEKAAIVGESSHRPAACCNGCDSEGGACLSVSREDSSAAATQVNSCTAELTPLAQSTAEKQAALTPRQSSRHHVVDTPAEGKGLSDYPATTVEIHEEVSAEESLRTSELASQLDTNRESTSVGEAGVKKETPTQTRNTGDKHSTTALPQRHMDWPASLSSLYSASTPTTSARKHVAASLTLEHKRVSQPIFCWVGSFSALQAEECVRRASLYASEYYEWSYNLGPFSYKGKEEGGTHIC